MALFSNGIFAVLNPAGFVASKLQDQGGGNAEQRVNTYMHSNSPLGCNGTLTGCKFTGTRENFEQYRRDWIQKCTANNAVEWHQSTNKTNAQCQAAFDRATESIRFENYVADVQEKDYITSLLGKDSPLVYLVIFLFVGLIIYLLMSKK